MKNLKQFDFSQKLIVLSVLAAVGPTYAQEDVARLIKPESSVSVGLNTASGNDGERAVFGQFSGMREHPTSLQLDVDYVKRDDASGTWTTFYGNNLGLDNREFGVSMQKQGDWRLSGDYSELVHRELRTINTANTGVGSTTPTVVRLTTPGTGADVNLQLKRVGLGLGFDKWFGPSLQLEVSAKSEDKDGARMFGKGYDCAAYVCGSSTLPAISQSNFVKNAVLMMAEPVNTNTKQFEARLNFHDEKLSLSAAYYGSFFSNANGNVKPSIPDSLNNGQGNAFPLYPAVSSAIIAGGGMSLRDVLALPVALAPDNQAHQFSFSGNYAFTPTTKATFKYAYTHATQDQDFASMGLGNAPAGVSNLGGRVDTTLAQFGLSAKPIKNLSLLANIRYERKEDKTPSALYNVEARSIVPVPVSPALALYTMGDQLGVAPTAWNNGHVSGTKLAGKLEASYQLQQNYRATVGLDYNKIGRPVPQSWDEDVLAGLSPLRAETEETGYRLELRRSMSETLTGAIGYSTSRRRGSDWTTLSQLSPNAPSILFPIAQGSTTLTQAQTNAALNSGLVTNICGGRLCYGQSLPDSRIIALSATTPFASSMADLNRDKWKISANWNPTEKLSLQFSVEDGKDSNVSALNPVAGGKGYRDTGVTFYNIDADFAISDEWKLTAYASHGDQTLHINHSTYMAELQDKNDAYGLGLTGALSSKLEIGANLTFLNDVNKYGLQASSSATGAAASAANIAQAAIGLPDVTFRQTTLALYGKYMLDKNADIRVNLVHQRTRFDEWTWGYNGVPWVYADNTTLGMNPNQNVTFIGASYIYKFQ